ncbi:hypothetical protein [Clostridium sp.]|uniref:hypothetical protein n=1 Tax=Clostridium sp. TaxID=1506 RepID=UPI003FD7212C
MINFLVSAIVDIVLIFSSYFLFVHVISGPTRHRLYEKFMSSFAKFVIIIFIISVLVTSLTALILYKTQYIVYINVAAPALVSIFIGFVMSTVPTRGTGDKETTDKKK